MDSVKIIQFTDIHLSPDSEVWEGLDINQRFADCWHKAVTDDVDLVVLSGDIAAWDGEEGSYLWLKDFLDKQSTDYLILSGNHDRVNEIERIFGTNPHFRNGMLYGSMKVKGYDLYFLDSTTDTVPLEQLDWISTELKDRSADDPVIFFMHHPPVLSGHKFMDGLHALQNHEETWDVLKQIPCLKDLFTGHYHYEDQVTRDGKTVHITPSTKMQIDPAHADFKMLNKNAGWREIIFSKDNVQTKVGYLD